jgi:hypothetical protein
MSEASRRRLQDTLAIVDFDAAQAEGLQVIFGTLTTPPQWWARQLAMKLALDAFMKRLSYRYGDVGAIIRRELGDRRGMVHFHLIIFCRDKIDNDWAGRAWTECLHNQSGEPLPEKMYRVSFEEPRTPEAIARYIGAYCSKAAHAGRGRAERGAPRVDGCLSNSHNSRQADDDEVPAGGGKQTGTRHWYVIGRKNIPWAEAVDVVVDGPEQARAVAAIVRRRFVSWAMSQAYKKAFRDAESLRAQYLMCKNSIGLEQYIAKRYFSMGYGCRIPHRGGFKILWTPAIIEACIFHALDITSGGEVVLMRAPSGFAECSQRWHKQSVT